MTDKLYTQQEVDERERLAQAAALKAAVEVVQLELSAASHKRAILALSDQSLLAKHDAELIEEWMMGESATKWRDAHDAELLANFVNNTFPPTPGGYVSRAEAAAVMETLITKWRWASKLVDKSVETPVRLQQIGWSQCAHELEAAIPTNYADALQERIRRERELTLGPIQVFEEQLECVCESNVGLCVKHRIQILLRAALRPNPSHAVGKEPINAK